MWPISIKTDCDTLSIQLYTKTWWVNTTTSQWEVHDSNPGRAVLCGVCMFFTSLHEFSLEIPLCHAIKTHVMLMKPNWDKHTVTVKGDRLALSSCYFPAVSHNRKASVRCVIIDQLVLWLVSQVFLNVVENIGADNVMGVFPEGCRSLTAFEL